MIKGDLRKKQILDTAEALFAERGYEETGVQDILDVLHLSKGSFYHHFESKEQVLQRICENRAQAAAERYLAEKTLDILEQSVSLKVLYILRDTKTQIRRLMKRNEKTVSGGCGQQAPTVWPG